LSYKSKVYTISVRIIALVSPTSLSWPRTARDKPVCQPRSKHMQMAICCEEFRSEPVIANFS